MKTVKIFCLTFLIVFLLTAISAADCALYCEGGMIECGDSKAEVYAKCGKPAYKESQLLAVGNYSYRRYIPIEDWIYNFGSDRFMYMIRFKGGVVINIHRMDQYGFDEE